MNNFTVVIPTLWKSKRIHKLLDDLIKCAHVTEIILIDNSNEYNKYYDTILDKLILISPKENIFVNPAWNLGVSKSTNNFIALINDDINFDTNIFELFTQEILDKYGIIGMDSSNYNTQNKNPMLCFEPHRNIQRYGWGVLLYLIKNIGLIYLII